MSKHEERRGRVGLWTLVVLACLALVGWWGLRGERGSSEPRDQEAPSVPARPVEPVHVSRSPLASKTHASPAAGASAALGAEDAPAPSGDEWVELNNQAAVRLGEGQLEVAVEMLERCRAARPENDTFAANLAEALLRLARERYENRSLDVAIESLDRALEAAPERDDVDAIRALRERWHAERSVEANHWTEGSDLFELSYDTDRRDILHGSQRVLDHLEASYAELERWFRFDPVRDGRRDRIRVVLYSRNEFVRLTGLGDWAGGAFDGVVRLAVEDLNAEVRRARYILTHELVHAFVHEIGGPSVPGWLNEGLAQYLSTGARSGPDRGDLEASLATARERLGSELFALKDLSGSLAEWKDEAAIGRAYAQSLLFVDSIARRYGDDALRKMIEGCAEGRAPGTVFEAWTNVPLEFALRTMRD